MKMRIIRKLSNQRMVGAKIKTFSDTPAGGSDVTSHIVRLRQTEGMGSGGRVNV